MVTALRRRFFILTAAPLVILLAVCGRNGPIAAAGEPEYIRVAIVQDAVSLNVKAHGPYEVIDAAKNKVIYRGKGLNTTVVAYAHGVLLGDIRSESDKILIRAEQAGAITVNGRRFRDDIRCIRKENGHLLLINTIHLEDYIKGVLYHEASHYWPDEVLKAQAIVCRTYAAYQAQENAAKDFDVTADTYSQVYGGRTSERYRTNRFVEATQGQVLTFRGKVMPAYFHATCGGHTEDASRLWNVDLPPLKGVACGFCQESPHFNWHAVLSLQEIREKAGVPGKIKSIAVGVLDDSGRITDLTIATADKEVKISAKDFRTMLGSTLIRSTRFTVTLAGSDAVIEGTGWGHGVGMCQWGAYFMAKLGYTFDAILNYYYPGSTITPVTR